MKIKRSIKNLLWGGLSQVIILALGLIIPRMLILEYGSEVNGLFSSVNQVFTYVALLEAGIGAATVHALYKPIIFNDTKTISQILSATKHYYKKVSLYYFLCVFILSVSYPLIVNSSLDKYQIALVIFFQGMSGVINFYFQATLKQMLIAEGKNYIGSNINLMVYMLSSAAKISLILISANIIYIQLSYFVISILQMLVYYLYFKKIYKWVDFKVKPDYDALKQKNSFLMHQVSLLIFSSTDMIVLSIFCDFKVVSVYAIYSLIFISLNSLINTIHNSISFTLGHTYHEDKNRYLRLHDAYDNYYITLIFSMISVCFFLIIPFLELYTSGIEDINYVDPILALLFSMVQLLTSTRIVSNNLIKVAGHVKQTITQSFLEAFINLCVSLVLVNIIGVYGVLIGTIIALLYRTTDIIYYANRKILSRGCNKVIKVILLNCSLFTIVAVLREYINFEIKSYIDFFIKGIIVSIVIIPLFFIINSIASKDSFKFVFNIIKSNLQKKC